MENSSPKESKKEAPLNGQVPPKEWLASRSGQRFELHSDRWQLSARMSVNVASLRKHCWSPVLADGAVRTLAEYAQKCAPGSVTSVATAVQRFLAFVPGALRTELILSAALLSYRDLCRRVDGHDFQISAYIRPFLCRWHKLGHPGIPDALPEMAVTWRMRKPETGIAVNRLDANSGPLMPDEHTAMAAKWLTAFEQGELTLDDYLMARLSSVTGRRPEQLMQLKLRDMDDSRFEDPEPGQSPRRVLLLHIPRIKAKGGLWRTRFRAVPLSVDLWNLLMMQRASVHTQLDALLNCYGLTPLTRDLADIRSDMPLIPAWQVIEPHIQRLHATAMQGGTDEVIAELRKSAQSDTWHASPERVRIVLRRSIMAALTLNREGNPMHLFPMRLRYTREFDLERAECAPSVIAWNMDHSNTSSLTVYRKNGPDLARSIGKAITPRLTPFVRMFHGLVIADEIEVEGGDDPAASRILFNNLEPGATCAAKRGCGMSAIPRPCYNGCTHFRPWLDGPHEQFLESLLDEREHALQHLRPVEDRAVIEAGDSLIISVVQVIKLCEERRAELAEGEKIANAKPGNQGDKK